MAKGEYGGGFPPLERSRAEWKKLLPADRYAILFEDTPDMLRKLVR